MKEESKLQRVEATPELLSEMEMLQIYGGDGVVVNPYYTNPCGSNKYCGGAYCGNCVANCGTNCTTLCPNNVINCHIHCLPCGS